MKYFAKAFDHYADFSGRTSRKGYWMFVLFYFLFACVVGLIDSIISRGSSTPLQIFSSLYSLALIIPSVAIAVRRLHDTGRSGWNYLWGLLPVIGWIMLLIWLCTKGDAGNNAYGPEPDNN